MNLEQHLTWVIPAVLGSVLKISLMKKEASVSDQAIRIVKNLIQGICLGYFVNKICIIKSWTEWTSIAAGISAFSAEYILLFVIKFRYSMLKEMINKIGEAVPTDDKNKT